MYNCGDIFTLFSTRVSNQAQQRSIINRHIQNQNAAARVASGATTAHAHNNNNSIDAKPPAPSAVNHVTAAQQQQLQQLYGSTTNSHNSSAASSRQPTPVDVSALPVSRCGSPKKSMRSHVCTMVRACRTSRLTESVVAPGEGVRYSAMWIT